MTETNDNNDPTFPRSRVKKQSNRVLYLFIITITLLTGGFYFYQKNLKALQEDSRTGMGSISQQEELTEGEINNVTPLAGDGTTREPVTTSTQSQYVTDLSGNAPLITPSSDVVNIEGSSNSSTILSGDLTDIDNPAFSEVEDPLNQTTSEPDYKAQITQLNSFYAHLDSQQYMQDFKLPEPSKTHFSKLIQKLIDNPPVVTRETDDLFTLLKNTAHFFRIIGKDNILVLKGILDREKDSFESTLQSLYILTNKPETLKAEYSVTLDQAALYDYACFFLNTMGGRLYLFRRDSNSRMAVSFYAIAIIDRANDSGNSRHGVDIRPGIDSLIEEIENGGKNLRMREYYLDRLYDLKVKYD